MASRRLSASSTTSLSPSPVRASPIRTIRPSPMQRRRSRKAATPTRAQLQIKGLFSDNKKKTGSRINKSSSYSPPKVARPNIKSIKSAAPSLSTFGGSSASATIGAGAKPNAAATPQKHKDAEAQRKLETDFSEFAVLEKKTPRTDLSATSASNDIAASIRARILKRQRTLQQNDTSPELASPAIDDMDEEDDEDEPEQKEIQESEESEVEEKPPTPMSRHDLIAARRLSLEREEEMKKLLFEGADAPDPDAVEGGDEGAVLETKHETDEDADNAENDENDGNENDGSGEEEEGGEGEEEQEDIKPTDTEGANKLAAAMAAVQAALADDASSEDDAADSADGEVDANSHAESKDESGPKPCSAAQNAQVVGTWTFKEVNDAFKTIRVLKDYTFTYREDRLPSEKPSSDQTWMRRKGHWGSSVTGEMIQLVFTFTEVVNGHIVNGRHTEDGPAVPMKEDWVVTLNELQNRWDKKQTESSDAIAERLQKMRVDLERAKEAASDDNEDYEAAEGETQPPVGPTEDGEEDGDEGEYEEEGDEYEEGDEDEYEGEEDGGEEGRYEDEDEEEYEEESEYEDEELTLEDNLVGTWQRQEGLKDREYESIQIFADGSCSHRKDRDFKNEKGTDSREWFTSKGTWTLDEEGDSLDVVFTKCSKGVQETEGSHVAETEENLVDNRSWSIVVKGDLFVNWEKEEEF